MIKKNVGRQIEINKVDTIQIHHRALALHYFNTIVLLFTLSS